MKFGLRDALIIGALIGVAYTLADFGRPDPPEPTRRPARTTQTTRTTSTRSEYLPEGDLLEISWNWSSDEHFLKVSGEAKNVGPVPLKFVHVMAVWEDKKGEVVTNQLSNLQIAELGPGQSSPFTVMAENVGEPETAKISFSSRDGQAIQYRLRK